MKTDIKAKLLLLGYEFEPIEENDDVYTIEEFKQMCKSGAFIDSDGMADYVLDGEKVLKPLGFKSSSPWVYPSDFLNGNIDTSFTHVVWYNK